MWCVLLSARMFMLVLIIFKPQTLDFDNNAELYCPLEPKRCCFKVFQHICDVSLLPVLILKTVTLVMKAAFHWEENVVSVHNASADKCCHSNSVVTGKVWLLRYLNSQTVLQRLAHSCLGTTEFVPNRQLPSGETQRVCSSHHVHSEETKKSFLNSSAGFQVIPLFCPHKDAEDSSCLREDLCKHPTLFQ